MDEAIDRDVRGVSLRLVTYTRALKLCSRMNYETEVLDFIDSLPRGSTFFDLGACEGRFTAYAALRGLRCFAFEPEDQNFNALSENLALNGLDDSKVRAFKVAVGATNHQSSLSIGQPWAGGHHKVVASSKGRSDLQFNVVAAQPIQVVSLDDFIEANRLPLPQGLKIDVDGSELQVLQGARRTLASGSIQRMIFELYDSAPEFNEIWGLLREYGYVQIGRFPVDKDLYNYVLARDDSRT